MRQLLADKVSGTMAGVWLLVPEHLRLGTWDLLQGWTGRPGSAVDPRLALQLVHEAALCRTGVRRSRSLSQKGFELVNGLPFVASDQAMHELLEAHTIADAQALQIALGKLRRASGHYQGKTLAIDPHHMRSYTQRQTRRHRHKERESSVKTVQTFFCLDVETQQPLAFGIGSSSRSVAQGMPELLAMAADILQPCRRETLVLADKEHFGIELFRRVLERDHFHLLTPIPLKGHSLRRMQSLPSECFTPHWAGFATAVLPYRFQQADLAPLYQIVQRGGEPPAPCQFRGFLSTCADDPVRLLTDVYPQRWHVEEFFRAHQALGWNRGGTLNLHIRYGQMTVALLAQAVIHQLRQRLGAPFQSWEAGHLADHLFNGLDGDIRVNGDTILVTYYNAPHTSLLREHYEHLPQKLAAQHIDPHIPWLYNFLLDFRFK